MKVIRAPRRFGKTTQAIRIANETDSYLVVCNKSEVDRLAPQCRNMPITYDEFLNYKLRGSNFRSVVIDQVDFLLQHTALGATIEAVTLNE